MGALVEGNSLEAEIAKCCQAIFCATEPETALRHWANLRRLTSEKSEVERRQFILESRNWTSSDTANNFEGG